MTNPVLGREITFKINSSQVIFFKKQRGGNTRNLASVIGVDAVQRVRCYTVMGSLNDLQNVAKRRNKR